jgi:hypothetical protein
MTAAQTHNNDPAECRMGFHNGSNEQLLGHLLAMCQRAEPELTLDEIVLRVLNESPALIRAFAEGWDELIRRKQIRLRRSGRPSVYEVVLPA